MFGEGDSPNRQYTWTVAPFTKFYGKIWVGFSLKTGKRFSLGFLGFNLKSRERTRNNPPFERLACFYHWKFWTFSILCNTFSGKRKPFCEKLEYRLLVETTKIESASFSYKTATSEAKVKTNRMGNTKWTYHK